MKKQRRFILVVLAIAGSILGGQALVGPAHADTTYTFTFKNSNVKQIFQVSALLRQNTSRSAVNVGGGSANVDIKEGDSYPLSAVFSIPPIAFGPRRVDFVVFTVAACPKKKDHDCQWVDLTVQQPPTALTIEVSRDGSKIKLKAQ